MFLIGAVGEGLRSTEIQWDHFQAASGAISAGEGQAFLVEEAAGRVGGCVGSCGMVGAGGWLEAWAA